MRTESDIRRELKLDEFSKEFPAPPKETADIVVTIDGMTYSSEAIYSALMHAPIDVLLEFLNYEGVLNFDLNVSGHQFRQLSPYSGSEQIGTEDLFNRLKNTAGPNDGK